MFYSCWGSKNSLKNSTSNLLVDLTTLPQYGPKHVCSGSAMVTAYDFESGRPGSNPEWGHRHYTIRLRSMHRAYPSLYPFGVVHWVPEQLNIKVVTGYAN